jgi:hypothetical protein
MRKIIISLFIFFLAPHATSQAQPRIEVIQTNATADVSSTHYRYLFENERFTTPLQEIYFDENGRGQFRYKRKDGDEIVNKLQVSAAVVSQVQALFNGLNFLASNEDYQHKKDFSHLGKVTISLMKDKKERAVSFNYTDNQSMNRLRDIFSNIAIQETRAFELETVISTDPISTPAQLRLLENELKSKHIADPQRFVSILNGIKMDEAIPLIARNHAERILQMISKGKV